MQCSVTPSIESLSTLFLDTIHTDTETDRHPERQTETQRHRNRDRQTERDRKKADRQI